MVFASDADRVDSGDVDDVVVFDDAFVTSGVVANMEGVADDAPSTAEFADVVPVAFQEAQRVVGVHTCEALMSEQTGNVVLLAHVEPGGFPRVSERDTNKTVVAGATRVLVVGIDCIVVIEVFEDDVLDVVAFVRNSG